MTRITFHESAESENERFASHAFAGLVGQKALFTVAGVEYSRATVVSVVADDDGRGATWTVDVDDPDPAWIRKVQEAAPGQMSFRFSEPEIPDWFR